MDPSIRPRAEPGSPRYLWKQEDVDRAAAYVLEVQDDERFDADD